MTDIIEWVSPRDASNFRIGMSLEGGRVTRWRRITRWWRPRTVVSEVDMDAGSTSLVTERWSWLRWRWERA